MNDDTDIDLRMRRAQRADQAVLRLLAASDNFVFERPSGVEIEATQGSIFELEGKIVAWESHSFLEISPDPWAPEPIPATHLPWSEGGGTALVGHGLVFAQSISKRAALSIHRLARTLLADERGICFTLIRAPLPPHSSFDAAGVCQQIAAGSIPWDPVTIPIADGYWPLRIAPDHSVWLMRESTWA